MLHIDKRKIQILKTNILPVIVVHLLLFPFWLFGNTGLKANISIFSLFFTILIYPIYLAVANYILSTSHKNIEWVLKSTTTILSLLFCASFHYLNWGISSGDFSEPDIKTIELFKIELLLGLSISILLFIISSLIARLKIGGGNERENRY